MLFKNYIFVICLLLIQNICQTCSKALATTTTKDTNIENGSPTTSYYRHNIFGPNTYAFGFEINDKVSGNIQFRDERRYTNGTIQGSYGYVRPDGTVMVTHFVADVEGGYSSQSQNFEPGDKLKWQENWPTKKPDILLDKPLESVQTKVVYDDNEKLNLTSILLPVKPIKEEHGIDLNPPALEKELLNPAVLEVINGETPLINNKMQKDASIGFETVHKFIPHEFPLVPFQLPQDDVSINLNGGFSSKPLPVNNETKYEKQKENNAEKSLTLPENIPSNGDKLVKAQKNNAEKSLPDAAIRASGNNESFFAKTPQAKSLSMEDTSDWYEKIIKETRKEYLESVQ